MSVESWFGGFAGTKSAPAAVGVDCGPSLVRAATERLCRKRPFRWGGREAGPYWLAGIVTTGAAPLTPVSAIENSSIMIPNVYLDWMSASAIQNHLSWYCTATKASLGCASLTRTCNGGPPRAWGNRRHKPLQKVHPGKWRIDYRGPVGVSSCRRRTTARREGTNESCIEIPRGKAAADRALQLVAGNDLVDGEKDRHVCIAEFDNVEQRLLFPGIADSGRVVDPIVRHRAWTDAGASGNGEA